MKVIKVALAASLLAILYTGCKKKEPNVEPVADTETQSAVDAMWATFVITDVDQIFGFIGEGQGGILQNFYTPSPCQTHTYQANAQPSAKQITVSWDSVLCLDGHMRDGTIFMNYNQASNNPSANPNSNYYRDFGFAGRITFQDYFIDGWNVRLFADNVPSYVYNKTTPETYDAKTVPLHWKIAGKWLLKHPSNSAKDITWEGEIHKILTNSIDKDIFDPGKQLQINWVNTAKGKYGVVKYWGKVEGQINGKPFILKIDSLTPLIRDFSCSPDPVSCVVATGSGSITTMNVNKEEFHPFVKGIATFTYGTTADNIYPRSIYVGGESDAESAWQCDNTGVIMIKGISYKVNFKK